MKQVVFAIALVVMSLVIATGFTSNPARKAIYVGASAPQIVLENDDNAMTVGRTSSRYTLLTLWKSTDAESRRACRNYDRYVVNDFEKAQNLDFVAVNMDTVSALFTEVVKVDNLEKRHQYRVDPNTAIELNAMFELDRGMGSMLISPEGKIIAFNPSIQYLESLEAR